jgi:hypothetical protein
MKTVQGGQHRKVGLIYRLQEVLFRVHLYTSLAKACTDEMWDHYFGKLKKGNDFTADYVLQRKPLISTSFLLDTISTGKETVFLSGPIPPQARRGKVTSNTAEQCNSNCGINKYREMPILDMVKGIAFTMAKQQFKASRCSCIVGSKAIQFVFSNSDCNCLRQGKKHKDKRKSDTT